MVEKMSTENRFSEDKDKPFAGACAATEWKIPSTKTISACQIINIIKKRDILCIEIDLPR